MLDNLRILICEFIIFKIIIRTVPRNYEGCILISHLKNWSHCITSLLSAKMFFNEKIKYNKRTRRHNEFRIKCT